MSDPGGGTSGRHRYRGACGSDAGGHGGVGSALAGAAEALSGGASPAPHFAMCRSGHSVSDNVEFKTEMRSDFL